MILKVRKMKLEETKWLGEDRTLAGSGASSTDAQPAKVPWSRSLTELYNPDSHQFMQMQKKFSCDYVWQRVSVTAWKPVSRQPERHPTEGLSEARYQNFMNKPETKYTITIWPQASQQHTAIPMGIKATAKWYS